MMVERSGSRSLACLAVWALAGCAVGAPIDGNVDDLEPAAMDRADEPTPQGEVLVDVTDRAGRPIVADQVWVSVDRGNRQPAGCFEDDDEGCVTWSAKVTGGPEVVVYAEVCDLLFLDRVRLDAGPAPTRGQVDPPAMPTVHLSLEADETACGGAPPEPGSPRTDRMR